MFRERERDRYRYRDRERNRETERERERQRDRTPFQGAFHTLHLTCVSPSPRLPPSSSCLPPLVSHRGRQSCQGQGGRRISLLFEPSGGKNQRRRISLRISLRGCRHRSYRGCPPRRTERLAASEDVCGSGIVWSTCVLMPATPMLFLVKAYPTTLNRP